ncbi:hypothetical protein ACU61A_39220 [Pseudonocardia sichuanensis]
MFDGLPTDLAALLDTMSRDQPHERPTATEVAAALAPRQAPRTITARYGRHRRDHRPATLFATAAAGFVAAGAAAVSAVCS